MRMFTICIATVLILFTAASSFAGPAPQDAGGKGYARKDIPNLYGRTNLFTVKGHPDWSYYIYVPENYTDTKKWKVFIGIHDTHNDGNQALNWWKPFAYKEDFILVCPNFRAGHHKMTPETEREICAIIEELKINLSIDGNKILINGFSGGACLAVRFTLKHPELIGAVSVMGARDYDLPSKAQCKEIKHIKFVIMVGERDDNTRLRVAELLAERLQKNGCDARLYVWPYIGHTMEGEAIRYTLLLMKSL